MAQLKQRQSTTMQSLISSSLALIRQDNDLQVVYGWMDIGDLINEKLRTKEPLDDELSLLVDRLAALIDRVRLDDDLVLYRGIKGEFDPIIASKQFNSLTPNLVTARTYGDRVIEVIVPKRTAAFYISAWELINDAIAQQEEKEILVEPGMFTYCGETDGMCAYRYSKS